MMHASGGSNRFVLAALALALVCVGAVACHEDSTAPAMVNTPSGPMHNLGTTIFDVDVASGRVVARPVSGDETEFSTIGIEDLNVRGMLRNRCLARSIADSGFAEFRRQLEYKAAMTGAQVVVVGRFFPSSKTCSECGTLQDMPLSSRRMRCGCGCDLGRDLNAALNIRRQALADASASAKPTSVKQEIEDMDRFAHALWSGTLTLSGSPAVV